MIIKTLSTIKKQSSFKHLVRYVLTEEKELRKDGFLITHNIVSDDIEGIVDEFKENDDFRTNKRKNSVLLVHEAMSFHPSDTPYLTDEKLQAMAEKYIHIRGHKGLAIAKPHFEKDHWHIHFIFSSSEYKSNKLQRLDNKMYRSVRRKIEAYQLELCPETEKSIVHLNKPERKRRNKKEIDQNKRKEGEYHTRKRGKRLDKDRLEKAIREMYLMSTDVDSFLKLINDQPELEYYFYRNKLAGVRYGANKGRKYRFTTLGITKEMLQKLERGKSKEKKGHNLIASVLSEKRLQEQLKEARIEKQNKMLEGYRAKFYSIGEQVDSERKSDEIKILLLNLLDKSKTMNQFMFFVSKVGFKPSIDENKFIGVEYDGQLYNLKELGLGEQMKEKQAEFEQFQKRIREFENKKTKQSIQQEIETDLYTGGMGLLFFRNQNIIR